MDVWGEGRWMRVRRPEQNYGGIYDKIFGEEPHTPATPALYLFIPYCISCLLEFIRCGRLSSSELVLQVNCACFHSCAPQTSESSAHARIAAWCVYVCVCMCVHACVCMFACPPACVEVEAEVCVLICTGDVSAIVHACSVCVLSSSIDAHL